MTDLQHVYLAYGVAFVLLGGYAILLWTSLCRAHRARRNASHHSEHRNA